MKKLSLLLCAAAAGALLAPAFLYSGDELGLQMELTKKDGEVRAKRDSKSEWLEAQIKMILAKGGSVKTGLDSYAEVAFADKQNRFRIKQESEVEIGKMLEESKNPDGSVIKLIDFNLKSGTMLAKLDNLPKGTKLTVGSPTAVAAASGTEFSVIVEGTGATQVAVLESQVVITSVGEEGKSVTAGRFQRVDVAPWETAVISAKGTGLLSEKILGKSFVQQAKGDIVLVGIGKGAGRHAHLAALRSLSDRVMDVEVAAEQKIGGLMAADAALSERVYAVISRARVVRSDPQPDGTFEEEVQIGLSELTEAVGRPLPSIVQTIRPVSLEEYGAKFGPLARVTTRRAAQVDALRKLAEKIYGVVVDSNTTVRDFEADDKITTTVRGIVQGGEIVREFYFSDGSVSVEVRASGRQVKKGLTEAAGDLFGLNYMSVPERILVDDFETYRELEKI